MYPVCCRLQKIETLQKIVFIISSERNFMIFQENTVVIKGIQVIHVNGIRPVHPYKILPVKLIHYYIERMPDDEIFIFCDNMRVIIFRF